MTHNECGKKTIYTGHIPVRQTRTCIAACGGSEILIGTHSCRPQVLGVIFWGASC